jgi:hypothetical protein
MILFWSCATRLESDTRSAVLRKFFVAMNAAVTPAAVPIDHSSGCSRVAAFVRKL